MGFMKTEQEQIEEITSIIDSDICDKDCSNRCPYCGGLSSREAEKIYNAGYRKVGKDEIVVKKSEQKQCREIGELRAKVKQAKIDVLNELKKYLHTEDFDTPDERWKPESEFCAIIDNLIKEVQNEN